LIKRRGWAVKASSNVSSVSVMTLDVAVSLDWECASDERNARPVTRHGNGLISFFVIKRKKREIKLFLKKEGVNIPRLAEFEYFRRSETTLLGYVHG
jgi:hypothetical protein